MKKEKSLLEKLISSTVSAAMLLQLLAPVFQASSAHAAVPGMISFQGFLQESNLPVTGARSMVFRIYDAETGGTLLAEETRTAEPDKVPVTRGVFNVFIGQISPLSPSVFSGGDRFLEVEVNGTLLPRQKLATVPYAFRAAQAESLVSGATQQFSNLAASSGQIETLDVPGSIKVGAGSIHLGPAGPYGAPNTITFTNGDGVIRTLDPSAGDLVLKSFGLKNIQLNPAGHSGDVLAALGGGNVGVGTAVTRQKLHVQGTGSNARVLIENADNGGASELNLLSKTSGGVEKFFNFFNLGGDRLGLWTTDSGEVFSVGQNGRVGVGTIAPSAKLDVNGGGDTSRPDFVVQGSSNVAFLNLGSIGFGTDRPDGKLNIYGAGEQEMVFTRTDLPNVPTFRMGRVILAGDGDPEFRFIYRDAITPERAILEFDKKGIISSVKTGVGSHFEGFMAGEADPVFRLNSYPSMQLEFGPGGNTPTDVAMRRTGANTLGFITGPTDNTATVRMLIDAAGNVGVGAATPSEKVEVVGNVKATAFIGDGSQLTGLPTTTDNSKVAKAGDTMTGALHITSTGTALTIPNGKAGIGTINPENMVDVIGPDKNQIRVRKYTTGPETLLWTGTNSGVIQVNGVPSGGGNGLSFQFDDVEKIKFTNDGNIGLGATYPSARIHVGGGGKIYLDPNGVPGTPTVPLAIGGPDSGLDTGANGAINILSNGGIGVTVTKHILGPRVGVGNTNPQYTLDVGGVTRASSFIGDGSQLTGVSASSLAAGTYPNQYSFTNGSNLVAASLLRGAEGSGSGGALTIRGGNAAVATGGAGGNLTVSAGSALPAGGVGYSNQGPAGILTLEGGGGYNGTGGDVIVRSGTNSNWSLTPNGFSKVSVQGGALLGTDGAKIDVEGAHNGSSSNAPLSTGGSITIAGGNGYGGLPGGHIFLNPGTPNGNVGIGTTAPTQKLDVIGTVKATAFQGDGSALTGISTTDNTKVAKAGDTMTGTLTLDVGNDQLIFQDTDGNTDEKKWIVKADGGNFNIITANDAFNGFDNALQISRTGVGVNNVSVPSGNVGVGTTAPSEKVDVVGNVKATAFIGDGSQLTGLPSTTDNTKVAKAGDTMTGALNIGATTDDQLTLKRSDVSGPTTIVGAGTNGGFIRVNNSILNNDGLTLYFDALEAVRMTKLGNVGIGSDNPAAKLDVAGSIKIPVAGVVDGASAGLVAIPGDDFQYVTGQYLNHYGLGFHTYDDGNGFAGVNAYIASYFGVDFFTAGQNRLRINSNGFVGVGTTSPGTALDIRGPQAAQLRLQNTGSSVATMLWSGPNSAILQVDNVPSANEGLILQVDGQNIMRLTKSGNVGIGTGNPIAKLHLADYNDQFIFEDLDGAVDEKKWIMKANDGNFNILTANDAFNGFDNALQISRTGVGVSNVSVPSGNVGVGTTAPSEKVEVIGNVKATAFIGDGSQLTGLPSTTDNTKVAKASDTMTGPLTINAPTASMALDIVGPDFQQIRVKRPGGTPSTLLWTGTNSGIIQVNGATGANGLGIVFDGVEKTKFTQAGDVGIGTQFPSTKLEVIGTVKATAFQGDGSGLTGVASSGLAAGTYSNLYTFSNGGNTVAATLLRGAEGSGSGGALTIRGGNAAVATGGAGGNLTISAGSALPAGGVGYSNQGPAGVLQLLGGGGYNGTGGNVIVKSGTNSNWSLTSNGFSKVSIQGGELLGTDGATIDVEGAHNGSSSNAPLSTGGTIKLSAGNGYGGLPGGHIVLLPGTPNGNVGIGTTSPASMLQVAGYIQMGLTSGAPSAGDCDNESEAGRMKFDSSSDLLYLCSGASGWITK